MLCFIVRPHKVQRRIAISGWLLYKLVYQNGVKSTLRWTALLDAFDGPGQYTNRMFLSHPDKEGEEYNLEKSSQQTDSKKQLLRHDLRGDDAPLRLDATISTTARSSNPLARA